MVFKVSNFKSFSELLPSYVYFYLIFPIEFCSVCADLRGYTMKRSHRAELSISTSHQKSCGQQTTWYYLA